MTLRVVRAGEDGYEAARRGLSASAAVPQARPALVAYAASAGDVAEALSLAAAEGVQVAVRSGGHSLAFSALRDGVLALDLSGLDAIEVDAAARTAMVGPGATSLSAARSLAGSGLAFPVGHKSGVGLGGFLLAGGNGWNQGRWGSAVESVLAADVVLADATTARLCADSDPEAFALLRGAGPGFPAVVTAFHVRLWDEPAVHRRAVTFRAAHVHEASAWADDLRAAIGPDVELTVFVTARGSVEGLDDVAVTVSATAYGRDPDDARALLGAAVPAAALDLAHSVEDGPSTICAMLESQTLPTDLGQASQQAWCRAAYADLVPPLVEVMEKAPTTYASVLVSSSSFRRAEPPVAGCAYLPLGTMTVAPYASWEPGAPGDGAERANRAWTEEMVLAVRDHWTGHYVGEVDLRATPERLAGCFRPGVLDRVEALRDRLDPRRLLAGYPVEGSRDPD
ncbi:FAD-binding oxidoreductase [Nocardioides cheoyonin]|uniref:FAD-binding oxidoreductase n=1 Tax=Nocardioides cheoyonin TaxID=3156615 RepID=UPI0032B35E56